jgi:ATP-dependent Clp protease ATP-binding subunit ClpX
MIHKTISSALRLIFTLSCVYIYAPSITYSANKEFENNNISKNTSWTISSEIDNQNSTTDIIMLPPAEAIADYLKMNIIDQDSAMDSLAALVRKHFASINYNNKINGQQKLSTNNDVVNYTKSNILIMGQTGSGKTTTMGHLRDFLNLYNKDINPKMRINLVHQSVSSLTRTGYVGNSVSTIISNAFVQNNYDVYATEYLTIIFIDEIDKLCLRSNGGSDIGGRDVQYELLTYFQGEKVSLVDQNKGAKKTHTIDTTNILFICAGAFDGLKYSEYEIPIPILKNDEQNNVVKIEFNEMFEKGFTVSDEDLSAWLIPELIGRLHNRIVFKKIDEKNLRRILTEPKNSVINQSISLLSSEDYGIKIKFDEEALNEIAKKAAHSNTGARSLQAIVDKVLGIFFEKHKNFQGKTCEITKDFVNQMVSNIP